MRMILLEIPGVAWLPPSAAGSVTSAATAATASSTALFISLSFSGRDPSPSGTTVARCTNSLQEGEQRPEQSGGAAGHDEEDRQEDQPVHHRRGLLGEVLPVPGRELDENCSEDAPTQGPKPCEGCSCKEEDRERDRERGRTDDPLRDRVQRSRHDP